VTLQLRAFTCRILVVIIRSLFLMSVNIDIHSLIELRVKEL